MLMPWGSIEFPGADSMEKLGCLHGFTVRLNNLLAVLEGQGLREERVSAYHSV